ncbi:GNAT family N-acetyltransferase [Pseudobdellovibrio sp. HCB154]|uniref:GNAT family N-acetyltransferase n=1 Tax=Pseudobdellovibrio sp. HCB154 TaxID=3386277 RepID=UPI00391722A2
MENTNDIYTAPATLTGNKLKLVPASLEHLDDLSENLPHPSAWHGLHWGIKTKADIEKVMLERAVKARKEKTGNCFAMIEQSTGKAVGMSNYLHLDRRHKCLEIGATWVGHKYQKTFVNTEAKLLMLTYAFETIGVVRVEFRVDSLNFNSQRAVLRLGAKFEGELRQTAILPDGRKRDYRIYSILDSEWPSCKQNLKQYLEKKYV